MQCNPTNKKPWPKLSCKPISYFFEVVRNVIKNSTGVDEYISSFLGFFSNRHTLKSQQMQCNPTNKKNRGLTQFRSLSIISRPEAISVKNVFSMAQQYKRYCKCVTTPSINLRWKRNSVPTITKMKQLFLFHYKSTEGISTYL